MDKFTIVLIAVGAIALIQALYGLIRRAKGLAFIGFVIALLCALALAIVLLYGDAIYITGDTYKL